jgi:DNA polymerase-3 subunit delta
MVAFKASQTASFIRSPQARFIAALVYGPEASLVSERARELARAFASAQEPEAELIRIDDRDLAENPDRLAIELQTLSMFAERRVVLVKAERRLKPDELKELLAGELAATLVVEAGNLRPSSPLRKLFEASDRAVALPCYADPARDMGPLIDSELAANGVRISSEARAHLINRLGLDLGLARGECAKLATYTGPNSEVGINDIDAIIGDMGAGLVDALASATVEGKTRNALSQLDALLASGQSTHGALAALSRYFQRLHRLCAAVEAGEQAKTAITKFRPPLHFKQRDALLAQLRNWSRRAAAHALQRVQETMRATRLTPGLDAELTERLLIAISRRKSTSY